MKRRRFFLAFEPRTKQVRKRRGNWLENLRQADGDAPVRGTRWSQSATRSSGVSAPPERGVAPRGHGPAGCGHPRDCRASRLPSRAHSVRYVISLALACSLLFKIRAHLFLGISQWVRTTSTGTTSRTSGNATPRLVTLFWGTTISRSVQFA